MNDLRQRALSNLRQFIEEHHPEETEGFRTRLDPVSLCGEHGKVVSWKGRCPYCAGHVEPVPVHRFIFPRNAA